ncbi:hypothetical protein BDM02DRAFT_3164908 [Thelephora ganbajun]|uniref:Uncharacterized protein n=1 Tax=Thelephora ganbajun TaxID=370292 RepID=A0ACB6ZM39_THEGA|nr:hypothetical protein BDM02DRAFT_3164908 [Thelephora ganbajun]
MRVHTEGDSSVEQLVSALAKVVVVDNGFIGSGLHGLSKEKILDLEQEVVRILAAIRSAVNELRPVNRLPPEIFAKVFEDRGNDRDMIVATHVCSRWRTILTSTPSLWTKIDFEYSARASLYLERSKAALIDVTIGKVRSSILGPEGVFLGAIPWVTRMKSLSIQAEEEQIKKIAARLCHKTPNLQSLTFKANTRHYQSLVGTGGGGAIYIPPDFLGRHSPLLRSLTFYTVSPSVVFTFPLPVLTHIDWVAETAYVVIEELLDLFVSSPLIETVKMHVRVRRTRMYEPLKEVTLSKLRKLDWADCDGSISLIPCLIAPELNDLTVRVTRNPQRQQATLSTILPPHGGHLPLLLEPIALEYVYQHGSRSCRFRYQGVPPFCIREIPRARGTDSTISHWLSPHEPISFGRLLTLTIEASGGCPPPEDIPTRQLGSLQTLWLVGEIDTLVRIIRPSYYRSGDVELVPCPALKEVRIAPKDNYFLLDELTGILRERKEAGHAVRTVRIMGQSRCSPSQIRELRKIVDEVIVP